MLTPLLASLGCDEQDAEETGVKKSSEGVAAKASDEGADGADDEGEPQGPTGELHEVGDTVTLDGLEVEITEMKSCTYDKDRKNERLAKKDNRLLGAHVTMKASGDDAVRIHSSFKAHDADKVPYRLKSVGGTDCTPKLRYGRLQPGEMMKGWVAFVVPTSAEELTVTYRHKRPKKDDQLATVAVPD